MRNKKEKIFAKFINDILPKTSIVNLSKERYSEIPKISKKYNLDFDDSYQTCISIDRNLEIVTMDKDFNKVKDLLNVRFIY